MRLRKLVLVLLGLLFGTEMYAYKDLRITPVDRHSDTTGVLNKKVALAPSILDRELDSLKVSYTSFYTKLLFNSSFSNTQQPTVELDLWNKSEMRFQVYHEKEFFFIDRWAFEFRKYVHGPKFAVVTIGISI